MKMSHVKLMVSELNRILLLFKLLYRTDYYYREYCEDGLNNKVQTLMRENERLKKEIINYKQNKCTNFCYISFFCIF